MEILYVFPLQTFDDDGYLSGSCLYDESLIEMIARADVEGQVPKFRQMKTEMSIHAVTTHGIGPANAVAQWSLLLQEYDSMDTPMWLEDLVVVVVAVAVG